jgi:hypothetical protein
MEAAATDSDDDGIGDIIELRAGQDPNGTVDLCTQAALAARCGCGAHIASSLAQGRDSGALLSALLTSLVLGVSLRRANRRARARRSERGLEVSKARDSDEGVARPCRAAKEAPTLAKSETRYIR